MKRLIALFLSISLILSESLSYAASLSAASESEFSIPAKYGKVEEFHAGASGKTIIYIQDAHDSLDAQKNIAKIISYLVKKKGIQTVFEEGFEGPVQTGKYFGFIKDPKIKQKISYFLLDKLRIGGAEYAHINRKKDFTLIGADDRKVHRKNLQAYRGNAKHQKQNLRELETIQQEYEILANQFFSKEFKEWMKLKMRFDAGTLPLLDYLKRTHAWSPESKALTEELLSLTEEKAERLDGGEIFKRIESFEEKIARRYLKSEREFRTFRVLSSLSVIKRLAEIKLSSQEFEALSHVLKEIRTRDLADFVAREGKRSVVFSDRWETNLKYAVKFYEIAHKRDLTVEKTIRNHHSDGILVFGGFHKEAIRKILKQSGNSFLVITPAMGKPEARHQAYYKQLMSAGYHAYEKPFLPATASTPARGYSWPGAQAEITALGQSLSAAPNLPLNHLENYLQSARVEARTLEASSLKTYQDDDLEQSFQRSLIAIVQDEQLPLPDRNDAIERLISLNSGLIGNAIKRVQPLMRFAGVYFSDEDMFSMATTGFAEGIHRFDLDRLSVHGKKVRLSTVVYSWMYSELQKNIEAASSVKIPAMFLNYTWILPLIEKALKSHPDDGEALKAMMLSDLETQKMSDPQRDRRRAVLSTIKPETLLNNYRLRSAKMHREGSEDGESETAGFSFERFAAPKNGSRPDEKVLDEEFLSGGILKALTPKEREVAGVLLHLKPGEHKEAETQEEAVAEALHISLEEATERVIQTKRKLEYLAAQNFEHRPFAENWNVQAKVAGLGRNQDGKLNLGALRESELQKELLANFIYELRQENPRAYEEFLSQLPKIYQEILIRIAENPEMNLNEAERLYNKQITHQAIRLKFKLIMSRAIIFAMALEEGQESLPAILWRSGEGSNNRTLKSELLDLVEGGKVQDSKSLFNLDLSKYGVKRPVRNFIEKERALAKSHQKGRITVENEGKFLQEILDKAGIRLEETASHRDLIHGRWHLTVSQAEVLSGISRSILLKRAAVLQLLFDQAYEGLPVHFRPQEHPEVLMVRIHPDRYTRLQEAAKKLELEQQLKTELSTNGISSSGQFIQETEIPYGFKMWEILEREIKISNERHSTIEEAKLSHTLPDQYRRWLDGENVPPPDAPLERRVFMKKAIGKPIPSLAILNIVTPKPRTLRQSIAEDYAAYPDGEQRRFWVRPVRSYKERARMLSFHLTPDGPPVGLAVWDPQNRDFSNYYGPIFHRKGVDEQRKKFAAWGRDPHALAVLNGNFQASKDASIIQTMASFDRNYHGNLKRNLHGRAAAHAYPVGENLEVTTADLPDEKRLVIKVPAFQEGKKQHKARVITRFFHPDSQDLLNPAQELIRRFESDWSLGVPYGMVIDSLPQGYLTLSPDLRIHLGYDKTKKGKKLWVSFEELPVKGKTRKSLRVYQLDSRSRPIGILWQGVYFPELKVLETLSDFIPRELTPAEKMQVGIDLWARAYAGKPKTARRTYGEAIKSIVKTLNNKALTKAEIQQQLPQADRFEGVWGALLSGNNLQKERVLSVGNGHFGRLVTRNTGASGNRLRSLDNKNQKTQYFLPFTSPEGVSVIFENGMPLKVFKPGDSNPFILRRIWNFTGDLIGVGEKNNQKDYTFAHLRIPDSGKASVITKAGRYRIIGTPGQSLAGVVSDGRILRLDWFDSSVELYDPYRIKTDDNKRIINIELDPHFQPIASVQAELEKGSVDGRMAAQAFKRQTNIKPEMRESKEIEIVVRRAETRIDELKARKPDNALTDRIRPRLENRFEIQPLRLRKFERGTQLELEVVPEVFEASGKSRIHFDRVANQISWNQTAVDFRGENPISANRKNGEFFEAAYTGRTPGGQVLEMLPNGNLGVNAWFGGYSNGKSYYYSQDSIDRVYDMLVVTKDQNIEVRKVRLRNDAGVPGIYDLQQNDLSAEIKTAVYGQRIVKDGKVNLEEAADQFDDLRHLFRLPMFNLPDSRQVHLGVSDGRGELYRDKELIRRAVRGEAVVLSLQPMLDLGFTIPQIQETFEAWGYENQTGGAIHKGQFHIDAQAQTIETVFLPGIHPHTLFGLTQDGELFSASIGGETHYKGAELPELARQLIDQGIRDAFLWANGKDVPEAKGARGDGFETLLFVKRPEARGIGMLEPTKAEINQAQQALRSQHPAENLHNLFKRMHDKKRITAIPPLYRELDKVLKPEEKTHLALMTYQIFSGQSFESYVNQLGDVWSDTEMPELNTPDGLPRVLMIGQKIGLNFQFHFEKLFGHTKGKEDAFFAYAGSGAINTAQTFREWANFSPIITGWAGGDTGKAIVALMKKENLPAGLLTPMNPDNMIYMVAHAGGKNEVPISTALPLISQNDRRNLANKVWSSLEKGDYLVLAGGTSRGLSDQFMAARIREAKRRGIITVVDTRGKFLTHALKAKPDILTINVSEFAAYLKEEGIEFEGGSKNVEALAKFSAQLVEKGIGLINITMGEEGMLVVSRDESDASKIKALHAKAGWKVKQVSETGAGDSVTAALVYMLRQKAALRKTLQFATAASALKVSLFGNHIPSLQSVREKMPEVIVRSIRIPRRSEARSTQQVSIAPVSGKGTFLMDADTLAGMNAPQKDELFSTLYKKRNELRLVLFNEHGQLPHADRALNALLKLDNVKISPEGSYQAASDKYAYPGAKRILFVRPGEENRFTPGSLLQGVLLKDQPGVILFGERLLQENIPFGVSQQNGIFNPPSEILAALRDQQLAHQIIAYAA